MHKLITPNIYLVIGLPGAGKTTYLEKQNGYIFDDMSQIDAGIEKLSSLLKDIKNEVVINNNIFIADVNFCDYEILEIAKKKITDIYGQCINFKIIVFETEELTAIKNVKYRNDGRHVLPTIRRFSKTLPLTINKIKETYLLEDVTILTSLEMPLKTDNIKFKL